MNSSLDPVLTREGWDLLTRLQALPHTTEAEQEQLNALLRKEGIEPALVSALLTQLELRVHAHTKFGKFADHMVFTRDGLEQATRLNVAAHHAERFRDSGATYVADLGCGIGSDSLAIAGLGLKTLSVDLNPDAVACAATNLRDFPDSDVLLGNVLDLDIHELADRGVDAIFADPARRTGAKRGSRRLMNPESWSPSLSTVLGWREAIPRVGIKVAPGITYSALPEDACVQWTSVDGSIVEAAIWTGPLAHDGSGRVACVIKGSRTFTLRAIHEAPANAPLIPTPVGKLADYLGEPDDAVIRAGLISTLADQLDAHLISESIAYVSATEATPSEFIRWFKVEDVVTLKPKTISAALRGLGIGRIEVKKRGTDIDPATLRRSLKLSGDKDGVVIATRIEGRHRAIIATRVS